MSLFRQKFNPLAKQFNLVPTGTIITFKDGVANIASLPVSGNIINDARITADTGHLYVWSGTIWVDQGDIIDLKWSAIDGKPTSSVVDIDDAVSKKHSNSLDHTQGTDQGLDTGGVNAVTATQAKAGYSHSQVAHAPSDAVSLATVKADTDIDNTIDNSHAPHSDDQVLPTALSQLSDDTTHRLVTDSEKSTWNDVTDIALNVILNAFRIAQIGSLTIFSMIKGFMDEYVDESGIDLINSINFRYDAIGTYFEPSTSIDSYTKLLLHFDGDDEALTTEDSSPELHEITLVNGSQLKTGQKKFGDSSVYFDGVDDYAYISDSDDWNFGANDFTIDFWFYPTTINPIEGRGELCRQNWDTNQGFAGFSLSIVTGGTIKLNSSTIFPTNNIANDVSCGTVIANQWYHLALIRNGNNLKVYLDGVVQTTIDVTGITFVDGTGLLTIGAVNYLSGYVFRYNGYIDEMRISKGIARWTTDFTPNILPYLPFTYNMTLISKNQVADDVPSSARIVIFEEDGDIITLNTDLKAYISRNNGTTFTQVTLEDEGNYITTARVLSGVVIISAQPSGTNIVYKIESLNNKSLKIHGTAISWK